VNSRRLMLIVPIVGLLSVAGVALVAPGPAGAGTHATAAAEARAATASVTHPCTLLSNGEITRLLGHSPAPGLEEAGFSPAEKQCIWNLLPTNASLSITYEPEHTEGDLTGTSGLLGHTATRVAGVGSVAYVSCSGKQNGLPAQCQMRANGDGKTLSFVLVTPGTAASITKTIELVGRAVYGEL
jgi:hypothetical protein